MIFPYNWYLFLHILGVIIFVGNIVVTAAWMAMAERTRSASVLRFSSSAVNWADVLFTAPGIILIVLGGTALSGKWGGPLGTSWLMAAGGLFVASGVVWVAFLIRYQDKMIRLTAGSKGGGDAVAPPGEFFSVLHKWYVWGVVATILPILASVFMVVKPF